MVMALEVQSSEHLMKLCSKVALNSMNKRCRDHYLWLFFFLVEAMLFPGQSIIGVHVLNMGISLFQCNYAVHANKLHVIVQGMLDGSIDSMHKNEEQEN